MKTNILSAAMVAIIGLAIIGCSDGGGGSSPPPPNPDLEVKERSTTINLFEGKTATVKGVFDKAGLVSAAGKIEDAIKAIFAGAPDSIKESLITRYEKCQIIIVEKTSAYDNWKTNGDGKTIYINFNVLGGENLKIAINQAATSMENNKTEKDGVSEQPIAYLTDNAENQIPIYKTTGVSDADATTAANNIKTAFNSNSMSSYRDKISTGVKKIYILEGDSESLYSFDKTTGILKVGSGWAWDVYAEYFIYIANNVLD